jgi:tetratricopeptide (TPR) repeat protein
MINNIGRFDLLIRFLEKNHATHIAALRNWFEVVNSSPLFQTDPLYYEVMQVFTFDPTRTRFAPQQATRLNDIGEYYFLNGDVGAALIYIRRSLLLDPNSARTNYLLGRAELAAGNVNTARESFAAVLGLQPDFPGINEQIEGLRKISPR